MDSPLDGARLRRLVAALPFVVRLEILDETTSTNDVARGLAAQGAPEGTVVVADRQTEGRGRVGRRWVSPGGLGLYVSVVLRPRDAPERLTRWTLATALAACKTCRAASRADVRIKWPNDLLIGGQKTAGILAEARTRDGGVDLIVGTGINVHHGVEDFPPELRDRATSLALAAAGGTPDRETLAADYLARLGRVAARMHQGGWPEIAEEWAELAPGVQGILVRVRPGGPGIPWEGTTRGIDENGALWVERAGGARVRVHAADSVAWPPFDFPPGGA